MRIHHYHKDTGMYVGSSDARKSPLWKPGDPPEDEFLIPALATTDEPPAAIEGHHEVRRGGKWVHEEIPKPVEPEPEPEPTEEEKAAAEAESLIQTKIREIAVAALKAEGKMTDEGLVKKKAG